jgi:hypothetical protein
MSLADQVSNILSRSQVFTAHLLRELLGTKSGNFPHSDIAMLSANMVSIQESKIGQDHGHFEVHIEVTLLSAFDCIDGFDKVFPTSNSHMLLHATESDLLFIFSQWFRDLLCRSPLAFTWFFLCSSFVVVTARFLLLVRLFLRFLRPTTLLYRECGLSSLICNGGFTAGFGFASVCGFAGATPADFALVFPILIDEVLCIARMDFKFV